MIEQIARAVPRESHIQGIGPRRHVIDPEVAITIDGGCQIETGRARLGRGGPP